MAVTTYLKLRLSSDLTADSRFNLEKIDALGSVYGLTAAGNIVVRASGSLSLEPNSAAVGGSGTAGDLNLGTSGHDLDAINVYGPLKIRTNAWLMARGVLRAYDSDSSNYIGLRAPASVSSDATLTLPGTVGSAGQVLVDSDGTGTLAWASSVTSSLLEGRVDVGAADGTRTQVNTSTLGDILASTAGGLTYKAGSIENADISASAAIAYSKLALTGAILNADLAGSIAYSKLALTGAILNADLAGSIAYSKLVLTGAILNADLAGSIALSKLAATTASRALVSDASGFVSASAATATELGYLSGLTSSAQTQIDAKLAKAGGTMTGELTLANDPSTSLHAATKQYVDALVNGIKWKQSVRAATTAAGTLATSFENGDTIDGVVLATGDRILIKNQATASENGIYIVAASGAPARATDADAFAELNSACVLVSEGTSNADKGFIQTAELTGLGSNQTWTQNFGTGLYAASGEGIELSGSTFSLELDGTSLAKSATGLKVNISGSPVGTTDVQALTAKDYDGGTASNTSRLTVPKAAKATLDALTRKEATLLYASDEDKLYVDDGSVLTQVGSGTGAGEKNYITNPSAATTITGWTASTANVTVARTATLAELPREFTTATGIKILGTAAVTEATTDYVYYDFSLDDVDLSKKLKIQWSQKMVGAYSAGTLAVGVTTQANRTTFLHTPVTTAIPAVDGVFTTSFDASTTATLSLVIRATGAIATGVGIVISDVVVGPGTQPQGAAVGEWQSFTMAITGVTSDPTKGTRTEEAKWRRVGDSMDIQFYYNQTVAGAAGSGGYLFTIPNSLTIDSAKYTGSTTEVRPVGHSYSYNGTNEVPGQVVGYNSTKLAVWFHTSATATNLLGSANHSLANGTMKLAFFARVPIAEWSGSGTVNLAQNDVEYAYNTSVTDAADTTSFGYGPYGGLFPLATATRSKRCQFQTAIQSTDKIFLEVSGDAGVTWLDPGQASGFMDFTQQNTTKYGIHWSAISSTTIDVNFEAYRTSTGATFGAAGTDWSAVDNDATYRWRVRKISGGAAVGFGNVSETSSGLMPATNTSLDNASATRLGLKEYYQDTAHSGTYNGGLAPTVTLQAGGGTLTTVDHAVFIPYQMQSGTWRMRFNVKVTLSSAVRTAARIAVNGVTTAAHDQAHYGSNVVGLAISGMQSTASTGRFEVGHASGTTSIYVYGGDVELASKPTWAY